MAIPSRFTPDMYQYYQDHGYWQPITFADLWDANARTYPEKEAVVDSQNRLTWKQAKVWIDRLAIGFRETGFTKDDVLAIQLPNSVELTILRVAAEKAGILTEITGRKRDKAYSANEILKALDGEITPE